MVLVGFPGSVSHPERFGLTQDGGRFGVPRQILSDETETVHALPVPVGQECTALEVLQQDPDVAFVELNYAVRAMETGAFTPNDPGWANQWGPVKIEAPTAWDVTTGISDVVVAILDTGVQLDHGDLAENLWTNPGEIPGNDIDDDGNGKTDDVWGWRFFHKREGTDFVSGEDNIVADDDGHGTHVAGIVAARINNSLGVAGIAGGSRLMTVKVVDVDTGGWYSDLAQGIVYAVDNGARIINLSLGAPWPSETLQAAVDYAHARGVVLVAASGSNGGAVLYPGACEHVLAVAATDQSDDWVPLSNYGPEVDVAAPGAYIYSTGWAGASGGCATGYCYKSGTSMATPHIAGLTALIWSARPDLASVQVMGVVTATAVDVNEHTLPGRDEYVGWGRIEASGSISAARDLPVNEYSALMTPPTASMTGTIGSPMAYTLTVRNVGNISDAYLVKLDRNAWEVIPSTYLVGPIDPDIVEVLEITVAIPITAGVGVTDTVDVAVLSVGDRSQSAISTLTTTSTGKTCYLPVVCSSR
jgi:subtilisin family serine protease